mmetsp:Transcript_12947/g.45939  ORF Transcript_12947/g.45939 Transcript_12947/m.45939 type:complete len:294 (+) Transcript_12947:567-1448(+)
MMHRPPRCTPTQHCCRQSCRLRRREARGPCRKQSRPRQKGHSSPTRCCQPPLHSGHSTPTRCLQSPPHCPPLLPPLLPFPRLPPPIPPTPLPPPIPPVPPVPSAHPTPLLGFPLSTDCCGLPRRPPPTPRSPLPHQVTRHHSCQRPSQKDPFRRRLSPPDPHVLWALPPPPPRASPSPRSYYLQPDPRPPLYHPHSGGRRCPPIRDLVLPLPRPRIPEHARPPRIAAPPAPPPRHPLIHSAIFDQSSSAPAPAPSFLRDVPPAGPDLRRCPRHGARESRRQPQCRIRCYGFQA